MLKKKEGGGEQCDVIIIDLGLYSICTPAFKYHRRNDERRQGPFFFPYFIFFFPYLIFFLSPRLLLTSRFLACCTD